MKLLRLLVCSALLTPLIHAQAPAAAPMPAPAVVPGDAPASVASVEKLLDVLQVKKMIEAVPQQANMMVTNMEHQVWAGENLSPRAQAEADKTTRDVMKDMFSEMTWDKMKGMYVDLYTKNFSQAEVDAAIAFYQSPVGQSFVKKQPIVMRQAAIAMQSRMGPMITKLKDTLKQSIEQAKAEDAADAAAPAEAATPPAAPATPAGK